MATAMRFTQPNQWLAGQVLFAYTVLQILVRRFDSGSGLQNFPNEINSLRLNSFCELHILPRKSRKSRVSLRSNVVTSFILGPKNVPCDDTTLCANPVPNHAVLTRLLKSQQPKNAKRILRPNCTGRNQQLNPIEFVKPCTFRRSYEANLSNQEEDMHTEFRKELADHERKTLEALVFNERYNGFIRAWCDSEGHTDKEIPYMGWFWRDVDFYGRSVTIGHGDGFVGFMESNKWGYPQRNLNEGEYEELMSRLDECRTAKDASEIREATGRLDNWMQGLDRVGDWS